MHSDKDFFHSLIQNSSDVITILSANGTILYESPSIDRLLGYASEELIGANAFELVHPDDIQSVNAAFLDIVRNPALALTAEFRFKHKNGTWRVLDATGSNQLGNALIAGIVVNSRDVTERKEAEASLREVNKRLEEERARSAAMIEAMGDGVSIIDRNFKVLYQNQVHKNLVGGDKAGHYCYREYANSDKVCEGCPTALSFQDGKIHVLEKRAVRDNRAICVDIKSSPLRDSTGEVTSCIEAVRDITEKRQIDEKLRESQERFRRIFEDGPLGIIISDTNYRLLKANRAFCKMLGFPEDEIVGRRIEEFTYPEDREKSARLSGQAFDGEIPLFQLEKRYVKKNGESLWVSLTATVIHDADGKVLYAIGMADDITGRKAAEEEREQLITQLRVALSNIKTLEGLIPMCAWCKKIRDDRGYWSRVETYIQEHSGASVTSGICPTCLEKRDPITYKEISSDQNKRPLLKTERRLAERIQLRRSLPCVFKVEVDGSLKRLFNAAIENISRIGMCINTDYPLERATLLISGHGAEEKIGVVRWRDPSVSKEGNYRVGVSFVTS